VAAVGDADIERVFRAELARNSASRKHQVAQQVARIRAGICKPRQFALRNKQDMGGGLRVDVPESETEVVFVDDIGRYFSGDDPAEQGGHPSSCFLKSLHRSRARRQGQNLCSLPYCVAIIYFGTALDFL